MDDNRKGEDLASDEAVSVSAEYLNSRNSSNHRNGLSLAANL